MQTKQTGHVKQPTNDIGSTLITKIERSGDDIVIPLTDEICNSLGWHAGDEIIAVCNPDGTIVFSRVDCNRAILSTARLINQEANARLIAAAPDLLDALIKVVSVYDDNHVGAIVGMSFDKARAAITKATAQQ